MVYNLVNIKKNKDKFKAQQHAKLYFGKAIRVHQTRRKNKTSSTGFQFAARLFRTILVFEENKIVLMFKKRSKIDVLTPYLQISFGTDFEALSNSVLFLYTYFVESEQNVKKPYFHFCRFDMCFTRKYNIKQIPLDSPLDFV